MSLVRIASLVSVIALALSSVACAAPTADQGGNNGGGIVGFGKNAKAGQGATGGSATGTSAGGAGTCDGACVHYLQCKGADSSENRSLCTQECNAMGYSSADLAAFEQSDCATAIAAVEGTGGSNGGSTGGSTGGSKGSECDGCVSDGSECVWISQSNWGQGPYSGAVTSCNSYCCQ